MEEIWKDIKGYEGLYQVSNLGNVRSLDIYVNTKGNKRFLKKGIILKAVEIKRLLTCMFTQKQATKDS